MMSQSWPELVAAALSLIRLSALSVKSTVTITVKMQSQSFFPQEHVVPNVFNVIVF